MPTHPLADPRILTGSHGLLCQSTASRADRTDISALVRIHSRLLQVSSAAPPALRSALSAARARQEREADEGETTQLSEAIAGVVGFSVCPCKIGWPVSQIILVVGALALVGYWVVEHLDGYGQKSVRRLEGEGRR